MNREPQYGSGGGGQRGSDGGLKGPIAVLLIVVAVAVIIWVFS